MGPSATDKQLADVMAAVNADPRGWIAQPVVTFSTCPTVLEDGSIEPRHVDLRPFAVNDGTNVFVLPGGLSRVALPKGSLVVISSQGGGSKDTWVLDDAEQRPSAPSVSVPRLTVVDTDIPERTDAPSSHDDRIVQQERQQQQGGSSC